MMLCHNNSDRVLLLPAATKVSLGEKRKDSSTPLVAISPNTFTLEIQLLE